MARKKASTVFRDLMGKERLVVAPGAYDPLSARIVESMGFHAVYMTGSGATSSSLVKPDLGFMTLGEMVNHAHRAAVATTIPVIQDADVGFGSAIHVTRAIEEFIYSGVAAVHIEDQQSSLYGAPGNLYPTPNLLSTEAFVGKIKAAASVRDEIDPDFVLIARTDASSALGYSEVVKRCNAYLEAGADVVMPVEAIRNRDPENVNLLKRAIKDIKGPVLGLSHPVPFDALGLTVKDVEEMGYRIYIFPTATLHAAARAVMDILQEIKEKGSPRGYFEKFSPISPEEMRKMQGFEKYLEIYKTLMTKPGDY